MSVPKISVIVPLFNKEKYIGKCLNSLITQTEQSWECIIINDGSTDESVSIVEEITSGDSRFRLLSQKNSGPSVARNKGIDVAAGQLLHFMDADDYYPSNTVLEDIMRVYNQHKPKAIAGNIGVLGPGEDKITYDLEVNSSTTKQASPFDLQHDYYFTRFFFDRDFINKHKIRFPEYTYVGEDPVFLVKAFSYMDKYIVTDVPVYVYDMNGSVNNDFNNYDAKRIIGYMRAQQEVILLCRQNNFTKLSERIYSRIIDEFLSVYGAKSENNSTVKTEFIKLLESLPEDVRIDAIIKASRLANKAREYEQKLKATEYKMTELEIQHESILHELEVRRNPGIKQSFRTFAGAVKRRLFG